jgi:hypothetical protein
MGMTFTVRQEAAIAGFERRFGAGSFLREWDGANDFATLWAWNCESQVEMIRELVDAATVEMNLAVHMLTPND